MFQYKNRLFILGIILSVAGCKDLPSNLQTEDGLRYNLVGAERLAVPANYIDSQSLGSMLVVATWPQMEGRTKENYKHYLDSHIAIHARSGGRGSLDSAYRVSLLGEREPGGKLRVPEPLGEAFGFEHSVVRADPGTSMGGYPHRDIYVRRNGEGRLQAVMRCGGVPAPKGRNPQCELFEIFAEMPSVEFAIGFDRSETLDQVNEIERAVREKFLEFKIAGANAYKQSEAARQEFERLDAELMKLKAGGVIHPDKGQRAAEWFRNRNKAVEKQ